jgi:hypothetical protein
LPLQRIDRSEKHRDENRGEQKTDGDETLNH